MEVTKTVGLWADRKIFLWRNSGPGPPHCRGFTITLRHTTLGRLLWTSHQTVAETCTWQHTTFTNRQTSTPHVVFELAIPASERPQTHALDGVATGLGTIRFTCSKYASCAMSKGRAFFADIDRFTYWTYWVLSVLPRYNRHHTLHVALNVTGYKWYGNSASVGGKSRRVRWAGHVARME